MEQNYSEVENLKRLVWNIHSDMPSRFQAMLCYCSSRIPCLDGSSQLLPFNTAVLEWDVVPGGVEQSDTCICSKHIQQLYYVRNRVTGIKLIVGSECINKFGSQSMRDTLHTHHRLNNYEGAKSPCLSCGSHVKKADLLYCGYCMKASKATFCESIVNMRGWKPCIGECAGKNMVFNGHDRIKHCNECDPSWVYDRSSGTYQQTTQQCLSCGGQSNGYPRCKACSRESYPIKCLVPECWNMIWDSPDPAMCNRCTVETRSEFLHGRYSTVRTCNLRRCTRRCCGKIINFHSAYNTCVACMGKSDWEFPPNVCARKGCSGIIPANKPNHSYCCWDCTPNDMKRRYRR